MSVPHRGSQGPLHLLIYSTGIKVEGEGEWNARKHGGPKRRVWRKVHLGIDEQTLEIRAVEVTMDLSPRWICNELTGTSRGEAVVRYLLELIGNTLPVEADANFYAVLENEATAA